MYFLGTIAHGLSHSAAMGPPHFRPLRDLHVAVMGGGVHGLDQHAVGVVGDGRRSRGGADEGAVGLGDRGVGRSDGQSCETGGEPDEVDAAGPVERGREG